LIKIIEERLATFNVEEVTNTDDRRSRRRLAFLDSLLTQMRNEKLTLDDIQEEVDTFMFAGHDTTATAITFFCYLMGCYPDIQAKVQAEIDSIFGGNIFTFSSMVCLCYCLDDEERECTMEDIQKMTYLDCVIKVNDEFLTNG
jgi:cytochrome P450